jgi:hypothetical protein
MWGGGRGECTLILFYFFLDSGGGPEVPLQNQNYLKKKIKEEKIYI